MEHKPVPYEEINQTIDNLAQRIKTKTDELDETKRQYQRKIKELDDYLARLRRVLPLSQNEIAEGVKQFDMTLLEQPVCCSHCNETVWDYKNVESCKYLLVPNVPLVTESESKIDTETQKKEEKDKREIIEEMSRLSVKKKSGQKKKKQTCSYCSQEGHKRSECAIRLSKGLDN